MSIQKTKINKSKTKKTKKTKKVRITKSKNTKTKKSKHTTTTHSKDKDESKSKEESISDDLTIPSLINGKTKQLTYIIYNKKPYGYFYLGDESLEYYGERKIKIDFDKLDPNYKLWQKKCITINFNTETEEDGAYLGNFFHSRKNELCLTKKNIKPPDMFPLFDIFIQELKLHKLNLYDASTLHLKYCNYSLKLLGLLEKNYTYYNKFGFISLLPKRIKKTTPESAPVSTTPTKKSKSKKTKEPKPEDFNKPLKLTPISITNKKILKSVKDIQTIKINNLLHILEHYHTDLASYYTLTKTKDILFDNLSSQMKYRIKEIIDIYNKENSNHHYKYSYNQVLNLNLKEFLSEFILFFCSYKKDSIKYVEKVNYITTTITNFIESFTRKAINKVHRYSKLYYYGKDGMNTMTGFDIETKKFIIKQCSKYEINITKNTKTNIIEIVINDI
jgi:hypothetical protein